MDKNNRKGQKRLAIHKETLRRMTEGELALVNGGISGASLCDFAGTNGCCVTL